MPELEQIPCSERTIMIEIIQAEMPKDVETVRTLFREYEAWLGFDLCFQGFADELKSLPGKYSLPEGRLFLASEEGQSLGCVALRKLDDDICEMKRLYVRPAARGRGLGNHLIEKVIEAARLIGYKKLRLDTHPEKMGKAVSLYESHGFRQIAPYYDNPHNDVVFMELPL